MIIKPYSAIRDEAFAAADYPACKLLFKCDEGTGNSLTESVSGLSVATGITLGWSVSNAVRMSALMSNLALGQTIAVGTNSALLMAVTNLSAVSFVNLGISGSTRLGFMSSAYTASDGTDTATTAAPTTGAILGIGAGYVPGTSNELTAYQASTTVWTAPANASGAPGDITDLGNFTHFPTFGSSVGNMDLYGLALFVFDSGIPADVKAAIAWMTAEWQRGNKAIYPGWKGLS